MDAAVAENGSEERTGGGARARKREVHTRDLMTNESF
jgi:hypothetical protein